MFDFEKGWTWLVAGLSMTVLVVLVLLVTVFFAQRSEQRARVRRR